MSFLPRYLFVAKDVIPTAVTVALVLGPMCLLGFFWLLKKRHVKAEGRVVAITGCDSGVGYSTALHCHKQGFSVLAMVLREESSGAQALRQLGKDNGRIDVVCVDVTKSETVSKAVSHLEEMLKANQGLVFHGLVNNAGVMVFGETEWQTDDMVSLQLAVNLFGPITVARLFAPLLRKFKGRIVNVSSHCASLPLPGFAVYAATKAGLQAWSDALRVEWSKYGVTVITVLPGAFALQTNILSQQSKYAADMQAAMTDEAATFYGSYFTESQQYMVGASLLSKGSTAGEGPAPVACEQLYTMLDGALLTAEPRTLYHITPWRYWFYHTVALSSLTPVALRDWLVTRFTQLPAYSPTCH